MVPVVPEGVEHRYGGSPDFFCPCSIVLPHTLDSYFKMGWTSGLIIPSAEVVGLYHLAHIISFLCAAPFGSVGNAMP